MKKSYCCQNDFAPKQKLKRKMSNFIYRKKNIYLHIHTFAKHFNMVVQLSQKFYFSDERGLKEQ